MGWHDELDLILHMDCALIGECLYRYMYTCSLCACIPAPCEYDDEDAFWCTGVQQVYTFPVSSATAMPGQVPRDIPINLDT